MPNIRVSCSVCKKPLWMEGKRYKEFLFNHRLTTKEEVCDHYICKKCGKRYRKYIRASEFKDTKMFKKTQALLQEEVENVKKRGYDQLALTNFQNNVKIILNKARVVDFSYEIINNKLMGLYINKVPFFGDVFMELKS